MLNFKSAAVIAALFFFGACGTGAGAVGCQVGGGNTTPGAKPRIVLNTDTPRPTIDVVDVPGDQLALISGTESRDAWTAILRVSAGPEQPPAVGQYSIEDDR